MEEKFSYKDLNNIHIGQLIKQKVKESGMSITEFSKRINCERTSVYHIFELEDIYIGQLELISKSLEYGFLRNVYL
ncbi:MAG: XRE family transcriptional regulator [Prevotellaceae bacterium]|nr:XRE family transcriptional regulator [Prevotellaceae bacterium]